MNCPEIQYCSVCGRLATVYGDDPRCEAHVILEGDNS